MFDSSKKMWRRAGALFNDSAAATVIAGLAVLLGTANSADASAFTAGNIVVVRVGDGINPLSSASTAVFLDEYTPGGIYVQTIPLPTVAAGSNNPFTNSGTAASEAYLNVSINGQYLVLAGYGVTTGVAGIAATTSGVAPRAVARVDLNGNIDTTTLLSGDTSYSGSNIRSATSDDGTHFWTAGTATMAPDGGVRYVASLGANTSLQLSGTVTNTRVIGTFAGQLYVSTASGSFKGVNTVGTGLPTTSGQTITLLSGFPSPATTPSEYDYFFADANTLYVADDGAAGGIEKWTQSGGTWTRQYVLSPASGGCRGLTGSVSGGVATLYATTTQSNANTIVTVTDTGASSAVTILVGALPNDAFRGLRIVPSGGAPGNGFCFGDGSSTACPCGNNSAPGNNEGCLNSLGTGGKLVASGNPSIATDTLVLSGTGMPNSSALYFQGTTQLNGGAGVVFGDGLRCAGGAVIRLGTKANAGGASHYPDTGDPSVSVRGLVTSPGTRTYQIWYRNAAAFCNPETFNLSNGWTLSWTL